MDRTILLTGMMGSGKSAVGRRLSERLGWRFFDTDLEVEAASGRSIPETFAREGEARFRELESAVMERIPDRKAVVALGGGALVDPGNRALAKRKGTLVLLEATPETLASRLEGDSHEARPLMRETCGDERTERLRNLLSERRDAYAAADLRVSTERRSVEQVCEAVLEELASRERS